MVFVRSPPPLNSFLLPRPGEAATLSMQGTGYADRTQR